MPRLAGYLAVFARESSFKWVFGREKCVDRTQLGGRTSHTVETLYSFGSIVYPGPREATGSCSRNKTVVLTSFSESVVAVIVFGLPLSLIVGRRLGSRLLVVIVTVPTGPSKSGVLPILIHVAVFNSTRLFGVSILIHSR